MEVDTAFFADSDGAKADVVDVNLGVAPVLHREFCRHKNARPDSATSLSWWDSGERNRKAGQP
jgi:hypothetical protein